jgi:GT2 family glycosyltransferase
MRTDVAVVVIGRNEGDRLDRSLSSVSGQRIVYADSGSTDGSPERAGAAGAEVIILSPEGGYSAARGRNAGIERLIDDPDIAYIQMLDGDCALEPGWIEAAAAALDADPRLGAVIGRLRERDPETTIYGWMCDLEWEVPAGPVLVFGGSVMLRADAIRGSGFYHAEMIAGEDPDFALRLGEAGWSIACLEAPMAVHDSAMVSFEQWWRRTMRAGHAFGELAARHPGPWGRSFRRSRSRILFWAGLLPLTLLAGLRLTLVEDVRWAWLIVAVLALFAGQFARVAWREARHHGRKRGMALSFFFLVGKYAELIGLLKYDFALRRGRQPALIEYKAS